MIPFIYSQHAPCCLDGFEVVISFPFFKEFSSAKWDMEKKLKPPNSNKKPQQTFSSTITIEGGELPIYLLLACEQS